MVTAIPDPYHKFDRWLGTPSPPANPLVMRVDEPCAVTALYAVITTEHGIPLTWLDGLHRLGTSNAAEDSDNDEDGHTALQEWLADTIPTNKLSVLAITDAVFTNGGTLVRWKGGSAASQYLEHAEQLLPTGSPWRMIFTNAPPTATSTNFQHTGVTNGMLFYRTRAVRPE